MIVDKMEKFDSSKHNRLIVDLPFSYVSTAVYLDFRAYILNLNGEDLVVTQDSVYRHDFPCLFLPKNQNNWEFMSASMVSDKDVEKIKNQGIEIAAENSTEIEYFYATQDFLNPAGKYKQKIKQFEEGYKYKIYNQYDQKKIVEFFNLWESQKENLNNVFSKESNEIFFFCLENFDKYGIEQIYVEIEGKLVGFVWGVKNSSDKWISLHSKSDYQYRGLSRFLNYEITKKFADTKVVSLGTGCQDEGLIQYKQELGPIEEKKYHYVLTRGKK